MSRKKPSPLPKKKDRVISEPNKIVLFRDKIKTKMETINQQFQIKKGELLEKSSLAPETRTFFNLYWKKLGGDFLNNVKKFLFFISSWFWRISVFLLGLSDEGATFWERTPWILQVFQSLFSTVIAVSVLISFVVFVPQFIKNIRGFSFSSFFVYDFRKDVRGNGFRSILIRRFCLEWDRIFLLLSRVAVNAVFMFLNAIFNTEARINDPAVKDIFSIEIWHAYLKVLREAGINLLYGEEELAKKEKKKGDEENQKENEDNRKDNQKKE